MNINMNIEERVKNVIAYQLNLSKNEVTNSALLTQELGADSLDTVEIIMAMEEEFGREFIDDQINISTVQDVIDYVNCQIN